MAKQFKTENDLCLAFIKWAADQGWTAYAETANFDILLVDRSTGEQIGVEAKLVPNVKVLYQAIQYPGPDGPDYRAVLTPDCSGEFQHLATCLGLICFKFMSVRYGFSPHLKPDQWQSNFRDNYGVIYWAPHNRAELPPIVPDIRHAGTASPIQLTPWKLKALRLCAILGRRGWLDAEDFRMAAVDHRRWLISGWLKYAPERGRYHAAPDLWFFKALPDAFAAVAAELDFDAYEKDKQDAIDRRKRTKRRKAF